MCQQIDRLIDTLAGTDVTDDPLHFSVADPDELNVTHEFELRTLARDVKAMRDQLEAATQRERLDQAALTKSQEYVRAREDVDKLACFLRELGDSHVGLSNAVSRAMQRIRFDMGDLK